MGQASPESGWTEMLDALADEVDRAVSRIWFQPFQPVDLKNGALVLGAPNSFHASYIQDRYSGPLKAALDRTRARGLAGVDRIEFTCDTKQASIEDPPPVNRQYDLPELDIHQARPLARRPFTFDRFVVGDSNRFAYAATWAVADGQELNLSQVFLVSEPGLGKSHLSHALGQHILAQDPRQKVFCLTAEDFTNELVHAIKHQCVEDFKDRYRRRCDVLVLEEVHFLAGKEKVQAELCYTLDCLAEGGKTVVFTSSHAPRDLSRISRPLASRLAGALISTIQPPDYDTRLRILERKAIEGGLAVADAVLEFVAQRATRDVRQLESCIFSVGARSRLLARPIDLVLAEEAIRDLVDDGGGADLEAVKGVVCRYYQVRPEDLASKSRHRSVVLPRQVAMYLARHLTDMSLAEIGRAFGRNHSTALCSVNAIESGQRKDPRLKGQVELLMRELEGGMAA